jgi:hypothetical protein
MKRFKKSNRNKYAISAQFRNSAGAMKDKKYDKKLNRKRAREEEKDDQM